MAETGFHITHWIKHDILIYIENKIQRLKLYSLVDVLCAIFIAKKAQQRLYFLCQLRKFNLPQELLKQFYFAIIESVLCSSITVWFGSNTKTDIRRLKRTVRIAERIIVAPLPSLRELYTSRVRKRAKKVTLDPSHPAHSLFELLSSGRCYRSPKQPGTRTVFPHAISHMNNT